MTMRAYLVHGPGMDGDGISAPAAAALQADVARVSGRVFDVRSVSDIGPAISAAKAAGGGVIQFHPGAYQITSAITTGGNATGITFRGAGMYATRILIKHATDDAFRFVGTDQLIAIEDMGITVPSGQTRTAGSAININGAADINLRNLRLGSTYNLITVDNNATRVFIDTVRHYREPVGTGTINRGLYLTLCTQVHVTRWQGTLGSGFTLPDANAMFHIDSNVDTAIFDECGDVSGGHGANAHSFRVTHRTTGGANFAPRIVRFTNCLPEAGSSRVAFFIEAGQDIALENCYAATSMTGFRFTGGKEIRGKGCIAYNCQQHGFEIAVGCDDIELDHCSASDNSQALHNTYAGFSITPDGKQYFAVTNCRAGDWVLGSAKKQAYGIVVWLGSAVRYRLQDNYGRGNATANLLDNGTASGSKVVTGNL